MTDNVIPLFDRGAPRAINLDALRVPEPLPELARIDIADSPEGGFTVLIRWDSVSGWGSTPRQRREVGRGLTWKSVLANSRAIWRRFGSLPVVTSPALTRERVDELMDGSWRRDRTNA